MRTYAMFLIMALCAMMAGCTGFVDTRSQTMMLPDGRVIRNVDQHDFSGSVAANAAGLGASVLATGAATALSTNWGHGYPGNRVYMDTVSPQWGSHWGSQIVNGGGVYGGYGYGRTTSSGITWVPNY